VIAMSALLDKIKGAWCAVLGAESAAEMARDNLVSHSRALGELLVEAKKRHPKVKDFEAFLKDVDGLKLSRAYDLMRLAGGRTTDEELRQDARDRQRKSRAKKKVPPPIKPITAQPEPTFRDVTESLDTTDLSIPPFLDRTNDETDGAEQKPERTHRNYQSAYCRDKFIEACRTYLPKITEEDDRDEVYYAWTLAMEDWRDRFGKKAKAA
jgi:hypothetical protein